MQVKNKKGSLNLSIQAIVIIVIAMTLLGLGLTFVRSIFADLTDQSGDIFAGVKADIEDKLGKSNDPLYFPRQKLTLEAGDEEVTGIGVKNIGDIPIQLKVVFQIRIGEEFVDFKSGEIMELGTGEDAILAGVFWDDSLQRFGAGEGRAIPITLTAPDKFGNFLYKIKIVKEDGTDFASKTFFIRTG
jgi:hypothetical protein